MLTEEIKDELEKIEKGNSKLLSKENINIIRFKNISDEQEEIDRAVICNLFFNIKWKLGDEFNRQILNVNHSIDSFIAKEINVLENNKDVNMKRSDDRDRQIVQKENIHISFQIQRWTIIKLKIIILLLSIKIK